MNNKQYFFFTFLLTILSLLTAPCVMALQLQVGNVIAEGGNTVRLDITVGDYDQETIAAAIFTLTYDTERLQLSKVESSFFDTFLNQWNSLDPVPSPLPPENTVVNNQTFAQPLLYNIDLNSSPGSVMVAGARVVAGVPEVIFSFYFTIDYLAPEGIYPIHIAPSLLNSTQAGYQAEGEKAPVLVGLIAGEMDPVRAFPVYSTTLVDGMITVANSFEDTDNDGIDDRWEIFHFGDLTTADATSDYDKDGYSDLQEYLNDIAGETDPDGNVYDPRVPNAPGGSGYRNGFWLLMLPAIIGNI